MQYHVTQERGTESAFTGELTFNKDEGTYSCVVCGAPLFSSKTKFDSGSGWSVNAVASTLAGLNPNLKNLAEHKYAIRTQNIDYPMAQHYRLVGHSNPNSLKAMVIEQVPQNLRGGDRLKQLLQRWPSFYDLITKDSIDLTDDFTYGMHRVETNCAKCGAHLGHVFDDGPKPTRKRYCINSASLAFNPKTQTQPEPNQDSENPKTQPEPNQDSENPKTQPEPNQDSENLKTQPEPNQDLNQDSETSKTSPGSKSEAPRDPMTPGESGCAALGGKSGREKSEL